MSQRRIVLSEPADASSLPLGEKATHSTLPVNPCSNNTNFPDSVSQRRIVPSPMPLEAICRPFGEKATCETEPPMCPLRLPRGRSDARSHRPTLPSTQPAATSLPSGDKAMDRIGHLTSMHVTSLL